MKTIKLTLIALLTLCFSTSFSQAENKKVDRKERITKYLVKNLALTDKEQKEFLPIYEQFQKDKSTLRKNFKKQGEKGKIMSELTNEEVEKLLNESFEFKQKSLDLKKSYHLKYKRVLSIKKIAKLYHLERGMAKKMAIKKGKRGRKRKQRN